MPDSITKGKTEQDFCASSGRNADKSEFISNPVSCSSALSPSTWYLCGDSTMADYPESEAPRTGWGQALAALVPESIRICNCAVNGRSSKSFIDEGRLYFVDAHLLPGDRVLIQFGHNDEKPDEARHTDPESTYREYLVRYIDVARRHGAQPILLTSIARRRFDDNGNPVPTHGAYPAAMRQLAQEQGVKLIDMERITEDILRSMTMEETKQLYNHVPKGHPNYPDGEEDNTHLSRYGAMTYANAVLGLLL